MQFPYREKGDPILKRCYLVAQAQQQAAHLASVTPQTASHAALHIGSNHTPLMTPCEHQGAVRYVRLLGLFAERASRTHGSLDQSGQRVDRLVKALPRAFRMPCSRLRYRLSPRLGMCRPEIC